MTEDALGPCFLSNLEVLRRNSPDQADAIKAAAPQLEGRLYPLRPLQDGYFDLEATGPYGSMQRLYGNLLPQEHLEQWMKRANLQPPLPHAVVLLGVGTGDHPKRILRELSSNGILALVEPDALLFMTAFAHVDLSDLLGDSRFHLFVGQPPQKTVESIGGELEWARFMALPYRIVTVPFLERCRPQFIAQFNEGWQDALNREWMYRRSRANHSGDVVVNTVANLEGPMRYPGVNRLFHHFPNVPAVLAAAGPSLEQSVADLRNLQDRAVIACVNTAYPILRKGGVTPNLVFTMDHEERNLRSFDGDPPDERTYLVADPRIHPEIIRRFHPRIFLASWRSTTETLGQPAPLHEIPVPQMSGNAIYLWLQSLCGDKGDVYGPGSVAVVGFHILARMGCRPIVLAGQDLAFTGDKHYASGTIFDEKGLPRDANVSHLVQSVEGKHLPTSETLNLYRYLLEHEIKRFGIPVYNTGSGATIQGTILTRMENIGAELPLIDLRISSQLRMIHDAYHPRVTRERLLDTLRQARRELQAFSRDALEGLRDAPITGDEDSSEHRLAHKEYLEEVVQRCTDSYPLAMNLLNELLQEAHFDYDDSRWRAHAMEQEEDVIVEKMHAASRALDAFVTQSQTLVDLLGKKIAAIERENG